MKKLRENLFLQFSIVSLLAMVAVGLTLIIIQANLLRTQAVNDSVNEANSTISKLEGKLSRADLLVPMTGDRYEIFDQFVRESLLSNRTARVKIWAKDGTIIYADEPSLVGKKFPVDEHLAKALKGETTKEISVPSELENEAERNLGSLIEIYSPIIFPGDTEPVGVYEIYQYYQTTLQLITKINGIIYWSVGLGFMVLYGIVSSGVWRGWRTITRQREQVDRYTEQLEQSLKELKSASLDTIYRLSRAAEYRDEDTGTHIQRMTHYTTAIARRAGMTEKDVEAVMYAAPLHDVGKLGIPDRILLKPGKLEPDEWAIMMQHSSIGERILAGSNAEFIELARTIALTHHEKWDGSGYPQGLKGPEIPLVGRIVAIADVFDALTSNRPYRVAMTPDEAFTIIAKGRSTHFDPEMVDLFLRIRDEIMTEYYSCNSDSAYILEARDGRSSSSAGPQSTSSP